jgi:hypothetical protein
VVGAARKANATRGQVFDAAAACGIRRTLETMTDHQLANLLETLKSSVCALSEDIKADEHAPDPEGRAALKRRLQELSDAYSDALSLLAGRFAAMTKATCDLRAHIDRDVKIAQRRATDSHNSEAGVTGTPGRRNAEPAVRVA